METSPRQNPWNAERIVYELMAIWFGSVHAMATVSEHPFFSFFFYFGHLIFTRTEVCTHS